MRKSKQDWLKAGLKILGEFGVQGLTIQALTYELGVTKGSFYHHFQNVEDFQEQLIAFWAEEYLSTSFGLPDDPQELMGLLDFVMAEAFAPVTEPEVAIRVWAQEDARIRSFVEQIDAVRKDFVMKVFLSVANDERQASLMTDMLSTMLIGSMTILPRIPPERVLELYKEFKRVYKIEERN